MKKYLVISYGDFKDTSKVTYLLDSISEITMTDILTYKVFDNSIIINFGTNIEFKKLDTYFLTVFERISDFYFVIEQNRNTIIALPDDEKDCFMNLEGKKSDIDVDKLSFEKMSDNILFGGLEALYKDINEFSEEDEEEDILLKKPIKKEYSLDSILDKINEKGISSLTEEENNYLKNLSK